MKKRKILFILAILGLTLTNCNNTQDSTVNSAEDISEESTSIYRPSYVVDSHEEVSSIDDDDIDYLSEDYHNNLGENFYGVSPINKLNGKANNWDKSYSDGTSFKNEDSIVYEEAYVNNQKVDQKVIIGANDDVKYVFYDKDNYACFVNKADGYTFSVPTDFTYKTDFSLGKYRSKLYNVNSTITISYEHGNPYSTWDLYRSEWLFGYLDRDEYYEQNNLELTSTPIISSAKIIQGYIVDRYDIAINNPLRIEKPYYNIAAIRKSTSIKEFYLIVMKSIANFNKEFDYILSSFKEIGKVGKANNQTIENLDVVYNPKWSEETKNYYELLLNQQKTGWGFFNATLPQGTVGNTTLQKNVAVTKFNTYKETLDYDFEIVPTYQHISWNKKTNDWPTSAANKLCGGNGFNNLPVIQMSYQYTNNNNNLSLKSDAKDFYSPIFDIYRGRDPADRIGLSAMSNIYESTLNKLAKDIKSYGKPVLFRLNNEMNTDWTSYCGLFNLLDPDLFAATWRILYDIFDKNEVDNCIWIFNPIAKTCPFSSWGEDMCYYPGQKYVQALGLTYYEDNNRNNVNANTFREDYTALYKKNNPAWNKYPWIISEFGCGSGGETSGEQFAKQASQAEYVRGMFADFNDRENHPYLQNIKGAVWFNVNDYDTDGKVVNQYELVIDKLPTTIQAFKEGLALNKK